MRIHIYVFAAFFVSQISLAQMSNVVTSNNSALKNPWTGSVKSEVGQNLEKTQKEGGATSETQVRLAYKITDASQLGLLLGGKYGIANAKQNQSDQKFNSSNIAIAGNYVAPGILGADKVEVDGRLYLPTSESAQKNKENFQLRTDIKIPFTIAAQKVATLTSSPRFTDYQALPSKIDLLNQIKISQGSAIAAYFALNHRLKILDQTGLTRTEEYMGPEAGLELLPVKMVKLYFAINQEHNVLNPAENKSYTNYSLFNAHETNYLVGAQIKI